MLDLRKRAVQYLREAADKIDKQACEISDEELQELVKLIAHQPLSKEQASMYLNLSRKQFDAHISKGELPKGKKVPGYKELRWYKDELDQYKK